MAKSYQISCPKCNNNQNFYRYVKDPDGYQKYLCWVCNHQFAPDRPREVRDARGTGEGQIERPRKRPYPVCPVCGKSSFLLEHY